MTATALDVRQHARDAAEAGAPVKVDRPVNGAYGLRWQLHIKDVTMHCDTREADRILLALRYAFEDRS